MTPSLSDRLRAALPAAIRSRDTSAVSALRSALAAIENAAAVPPPGGADGRTPIGLPAIGLGVTEVARREQDGAEVERIVRAEISDRHAAADEYERLGRRDRADRLRAEAKALLRHVDAP
jgi:uncharacterized protein YqeY